MKLLTPADSQTTFIPTTNTIRSVAVKSPCPPMLYPFGFHAVMATFTLFLVTALNNNLVITRLGITPFFFVIILMKPILAMIADRRSINRIQLALVRAILATYVFHTLFLVK
jgi:hypothetical protein